ncbi:MAG: adventurous gliding motility protein GltG [Myxococcales bacterium]|nr:adventurous gliding motility protein GltG [Myxococcales bacterium]MDP3502331.1 adventurous gliding motility protein GltG [Myxococcales bacterium]
MPVPLTLKVFKGEQLISSKDFDRDLIKIGRLASAHLTIDDEKVARIHAVIDVAPDGTLSVTDMGTVEGTMLNGKRVMKSPLSFGDAIQVGGTTIRIEKAGAAPAIAPTIAPVADAAATQPFVATVAAPQVVAAQVQVVAAPQVVHVPAPAPAYRPPPSPPEELVEERISPRMRPRRRKGSGPLGVELRFLWGDHIVGEYFLSPGVERSFKVGSGQGVDFEMGDISGPLFELVRFGKNGAQLRFTTKMEGEVHRKFGDEVLSLADAKKKGLAQADGDAVALTLSNDDFAWIELGGITVEAFFQPVPKPVFVPFSETVDFTVLNIFLVAFFIAALFIISAANRDAEGDEFADDLNNNQARIAKLLIKPPETQKNPILEKYEKKKDSGEIAAKRKGDEGSMGKKEAPKRSAHAAPKGDPNNKDQARLLVAKVFGGGTGGISTIFGHQGLGGELKSAMGNMFGAAPGDAAGLGGLGLRGSGSGGGGLGDTIGIGGIGTRGRGGGTGGYGTGVGVLGGKKDVDIGITSSEPTVMGSLDKELIRKVIHANRSQIRFCYESQLNRYPKLEGKVAVKFIISASGAVASSSVAQSSAGNAELEACVAGRVRTWVFPKPKGGGVVVVTYPFIFKQSGQ